MEFYRPIYWHEGMLLRPQHFQQQDRYHESLLHHLLVQANPYYWGISELRVNPDSLHNMLFEIEGCSLVLNNGSVVLYPGNAEVEHRSFEKALPAGGQSLSVYLGVMQLKPGENNVVSPHDGDESFERHCRYRIKDTGSATYDLFAAERSGPIDFLHYDVRLFFGPEKDNATDYHLVKIAEVERSEKGFVLSRRFVPPTVTVAADPILFGLLKKVRDRMTAKGRELEDFKHERGLLTHELGSRDVLYLLFALTINRHIPLLHQMTAEGAAVHPLGAYQLLRVIIGELSAFSQEVGILGGTAEQGEAGLPDYQHEDLWNCFQPAADLVERLLDGLVARGAYSARLTWDGEFYSAGLDKQIFTGNNRYYLIISTSVPLNELLAMMKDTAKICSKEGVPTLISRALYGVPVEHLPAPPPKLPQRAHAYYFLLDHNSNVWKRIEKDSNIAVSFEKKQIEDMNIEFTVLSEERS